MTTLKSQSNTLLSKQKSQIGALYRVKGGDLANSYNY